MEAASITDLNLYVKSVLEKDEILQNVYVIGEISNLKIYPSGHIYFSLKDEKCSVKCVIFSSYKKKISFNLENGVKIFAYGSVSCYEISGQYQLYVYYASPAGIGEINESLKKLYEKLKSEGIFDENKKKQLKKFPRKIGVITSKSGAVIHDISSVCGRRFPLAELVLYSVKVQGEKASDEIVNGLKVLQNHEEIDVIILARGGGSLEDLWSFNNEKVVREIYNCKIPIISAVGHDVDYTLCDYAADVRASTPSVAAELACETLENISVFIGNTKQKFYVYSNQKIKEENYRLEKCKNRLNYKSLVSTIMAKQNLICFYKEKIKFKSSKFLENYASKINLLKTRLNFLNPTNILKKGYTIVRCGKKVVKNSHDLKNEIDLTFYNSEAHIKIKEIIRK